MSGYKIQPKFSFGEKVSYKTVGQGGTTKVEVYVHTIIAAISITGEKSYKYGLVSNKELLEINGQVIQFILEEERLDKITDNG